MIKASSGEEEPDLGGAVNRPVNQFASSDADWPALLGRSQSAKAASDREGMTGRLCASVGNGRGA